MRLRNGDWAAAFERLDERGGGVIWVPAGVHHCEPVTIDLADYPSLDHNVAIRGEGCGASVLHFGQGPGDGFGLVDGDGRDHFYLEVDGVQFRGARDGVLFRVGRDDFADAYNSCQFRLATNNGSPDATAACRLNHVLNSEHFGVHNAEAGTALDLRQVSFGGLRGSVRSNRGVSLAFGGYSFANVVEWLNVEECADGVLIAGADSNINRFGMLYGANVSGTLWRHEAAVQTRIDAAFVGDGVNRIDARTDGEYAVGVSNREFTGATGTAAPGEPSTPSVGVGADEE